MVPNYFGSIVSSGTRKMEISLLILRLMYILPYPHLARLMLLRGNVMWRTMLRVGTIGS